MMEKNFRHKRKLLLASTITLFLLTLTTPNSASTSEPESLENNNSSYYQIPGLYPQDDLITPIQGEHQFRTLIMGARSDETEPGHEHHISLVQFYMATCPDCQGFAPYFKRFVQNIEPHWRRLVRVYVVNCNDDLNINTCWKENPSLMVPLVRWYTLPGMLNSYRSPNSKKSWEKVFDIHSFSDNHRRIIEKQRRDLISLRHKTLHFISSNVKMMEDIDKHKESYYKDVPMNLYKFLKPISWYHFQSLGRSEDKKKDLGVPDQTRFDLELESRHLECRRWLGKPKNRETIIDFVVFEPNDSYLGKMLVADWSNHSCSSTTDKLFMVHYSNELGLLGPSGANLSVPQLYTVEAKFVEIELKKVATSGHLNMRRRRRWAPQLTVQANQTGSSQQRMSLEQYYSKRKPGPTNHRHPANRDGRMAKRRLRRLAAEDDSEKAKNRAQMQAENINWAPPELYPNEEELLRHTFNRDIARKVLAPGTDFQQQVAGWTIGELGEIKMPPRQSQQVAVAPKDEDLSLVTLTDYYKVLAEIVHKNSRKRIDGYQFLGLICFVDELTRHFPFQGLSGANHSSRTQDRLVKYRDESFFYLLFYLARRERLVCSETLKLTEMDVLELKSYHKTEESMEKLTYLVKLNQSSFEWAYCAGSSPHLRGYTCSLWLLFHTLTVQEYLESNATETEKELYRYGELITPSESEYSTEKGNQSSAHNHTCDLRQPEAAFLKATSSDLLVGAPQFALANIINFVRYYLPCTNCAAHFSCIVERSMNKLNFTDPRPGDHLLFLWEVHNRVNLRTRNTHSEDPAHPKHVFPAYDACPACYWSKPSNPVDLDDMYFNRGELIKFLVARYRRTAIINNRIHIEDIIHKSR